MASTLAHAQADRRFIREGNALYRQKDYAQAEVMYRKALAANEDNAQAVYNLGCALMMQQKDSAAVVQYEKAAKMEKGKLRQSKAYHNMGVICQNHKLYDDAIKAYQQSLRLNPGDDETRYNLALCKKLRKDDPNGGGGGGQQDQQQDQQDQQQNNQNKDQNQDQQQQQQQQQQQDQMSRENAEQLLEAAQQREKETQRKLQKAAQQPRSRQVEKNW